MNTEKEVVQTKEKFNLGSKNVRKTFLSILIPTLIAQVIAGTFIVFDTFFVSHGFQASSVFNFSDYSLIAENSSYAALGPAAISYAMPYTFLIIGIGLSIGGGLSAIMTKQMANNDKIGEQKTMNSYMPLSIYGGLLIMIIILIFAKVLVWLGSGFQKDYLDAWFANPLMDSNWSVDANNITSATYKYVNGHILSQSAWYLRIQALGAIPYIYMSAGVIMLRVQGKAQYATSFSAVGLVTNIFLDFLFIIVLKMNVVGAAIATVVGQYATAAIYWWYFQFRADVKAKKLDWSHSNHIMKETFIGGVSIMMLQVITAITLLLFTFSIGITNYGNMYDVTNYTSVYQGYNSVFIFCNLIIIAAAQSMKPIVEYNYIKGDMNNVRKARNWGYGFAMSFSFMVTILIVIFRNEVIGVFYKVDGSAVDYITTGFFINAGRYLDGAQIFTNGMAVAGLITGILFISFPIASGIQMSGAYIQSLGQNQKTSIILFGKIILLLPIILIMGFLAADLVHSNWEYNIINDNITSFETESANLGMFLALPITDLLIGLLTFVYFYQSEKLIKVKNS
ncbi:MAG: MATE family efflux transporter [Candidatus Tyloplasma litorale]|nr:MAG: MATE family efflux transporter [Mycoplasmatales bacterium]